MLLVRIILMRCFQVPKTFVITDQTGKINFRLNFLLIWSYEYFSNYMLEFVCLFDSLRSINNLSVKQGRVFLG